MLQLSDCLTARGGGEGRVGATTVRLSKSLGWWGGKGGVLQLSDCLRARGGGVGRVGCYNCQTV